MSAQDDLNRSREERSVVESVSDDDDDASSSVWDDDDEEEEEQSVSRRRPDTNHSTIMESASNHTGTGTHLSFVEHQFRRERGNSSADETAAAATFYPTSTAASASNHQQPQSHVDTTTTTTTTAAPDDHLDTSTAAAGRSDDGEASVVPADQERQLILLMLLAQVCALHDPTPRTFTVHVLEFFERGILDRQSIHFLYDLGLVPAVSVATASSSSSGSSANKKSPLLLTQGTAASGAADLENNSYNDELTITVPATSTTSMQHFLKQRSMEVSAIRSTLEHHDRQQQQQQFRRSQSDPSQGNPNQHQQKTQQLSWSVGEHPLSPSRYQREFEQIGLLASGSFGQVFRAASKMDGRREYAIKRVSFAAAGYSHDSVRQVVREVHCLAACDHPHVVRYYTSWLEPSWMTGSTAAAAASCCGNDDDESESGSGSKQHLKLLTDIQRKITSGEGFESCSDDLKAYFKDPSFGRTPNQRRSSAGGSVDDDSVSSWGQQGEDYSEWTIEGTVDDIFVDGYIPRDRQRKPTIARHNSAPLFDGDASDDGPWREPQKLKSPSRKERMRPNFRYQICLYIQMELCHPATLADWIRTRNQKMRDQSLGDRLEVAAEIFGQIVDGLGHVHETGIFHRDLKPANVFASADGLHFKIGDFGLSKLIQSFSPKSSETASSPTRRSGRLQRRQQLLLLEYVNQKHPLYQTEDPGTTAWQDPLTAGVGTASYAAPEQVASRNYGTAADIFSLGLILLELLCCFSTEHERLQTFHDCRHRRSLPAEFDDYPIVAQTILSCTEPKAAKRPTASDLKTLIFRADSRHCEFPVTDGETVAALKQQLAEKEQQLDECNVELERKDQIIEELRRQVETMHLGRSCFQPFQSPTTEDDADLEAPASSSSYSSDDGI